MGALPLIGAMLSAGGQIAGGYAAKQSADFEADQLDAQAKEETAASTRDAAASRKEAELAMSRGQALAAASGGGASTDAPTILKLMSDTAGQGELNAQTAMYGGLSRAAGLRTQAAGRRASGKASFLGSTIGAFGTAAEGGYKFGKSKGWIK